MSETRQAQIVMGLSIIEENGSGVIAVDHAITIGVGMFQVLAIGQCVGPIWRELSFPVEGGIGASGSILPKINPNRKEV
ncbi:MAG: hypothetical protein AAF206_05145 [Bacteroidota bacterium]